MDKALTRDEIAARFEVRQHEFDKLFSKRLKDGFKAAPPQVSVSQEPSGAIRIDINTDPLVNSMLTLIGPAVGAYLDTVFEETD